jgi:histidinol-phosphate aminotransferase
MTFFPKPRNINVERYIEGLSKLKDIKNPIKLSANESALGPSPKAIRSLEKDKYKVLKYPESDSDSLRQCLSKKFKIDPTKIICGSGSDQIFDLTCKVFLKPGDEVIVTEFGFIMHRIYALHHKAKVVLAKEKNFKASVDEILKKVSKKTKIIFIANPNNPTGTYLSKKEILNLRKRLRSNILLVIDDAYFEYLDNKDFASGLEIFPNPSNVLITRTFSKIYGLAGLRLGWGYSSKKIINAMYEVKPPFNINRAAQAAGVEAIKDTKWVNRAIDYNKEWSKKIYSVLQDCKISTNKPTANFFLLNFDKTAISSNTAFKRLSKKRLILRQMKQYKIYNSLRLTIGNKRANQHFIKSIRSILK